MHSLKPKSLTSLSLLVILILAACGSSQPALTNGTDTFPLTAVTFPESVKTESGQTYRSEDPNFKILRAEFTCPEGKSLTGLFSGTDDSVFASLDLFSKSGFPNVYFTDTKGEKYVVALIEKCAVSGPVPLDGSGFSLQFMELEPVPLGQ